MCSSRRVVLTAIVLLSGLSSHAAAQAVRLDSARLLAHLSVLAADSMEGRGMGTPGGARARRYLLGAFSHIGLQPVGDGYLARFSTSTPAGADGFGVNLVGLVPGTRRSDRYVVVSAHYDHLGIRGDEIFNGADDNASGTSGVLAIAQWFQAHPPRNSLLFVLFDGEERGELGSRAFVATPPVPLERIVADVNLDMVSRSTKGELYAAGASPFPVLRPLLDSTVRVSPVKLRLGHDTGSGRANWIHQSDQGPFADRAIPFAYFGVEDHPDYHHPTDRIEHIDPAFFFHAVQTVAVFVTMLDHALDPVATVRASGAR